MHAEHALYHLSMTWNGCRCVSRARKSCGMYVGGLERGDSEGKEGTAHRDGHSVGEFPEGWKPVSGLGPNSAVVLDVNGGCWNSGTAHRDGNSVGTSCRAQKFGDRPGRAAGEFPEGWKPVSELGPNTERNRNKRKKAKNRRKAHKQHKSQGTASSSRDSQASLQIARLERSEFSREPANTQVFNGHRFFQQRLTLLRIDTQNGTEMQM
jgi:hypothetical protein